MRCLNSMENFPLTPLVAREVRATGRVARAQSERSATVEGGRRH